MPIRPPFYTPRLPGAGGGGGGLRIIPRTPSKGEDLTEIIAQALMGYMQGKEMKRGRGLEERKFGLEEEMQPLQKALMQAQTQKLLRPPTEKAPTIAGMRAKRATEVEAVPGTKEFEKIAGKTTEPFTKGRIQQTLGELEAGGAQDMLGMTIEFGSRKDATDHTLRRLGPNWKQLAPEAEEIIDRKWPEKGKVKVGQTIVNPTTGERRKWNGKKWVLIR